jgi:uncharacterized protein YebE (UPF0316 family)
MLIKFLLILIIGTAETWCFTKWSLRANKQRAINSSVMMMLYMTIYLKILDSIFKDTNTNILIIAYVLACGIGNFIAVKNEKKTE